MNPDRVFSANEILKQVAGEVSGCAKCALHYSRKLAVPGEGPANAEIMFIGEGPGFYENEQGRPFVGPSGKFLDELLASIQMKRAEVFIANVVKCRPPSNRDPLPEELSACKDYLERQIQAIQPKVIVTLGRYSMAHFLPNARISDIHGQAMNVRGRLIVAMYHPAAALHQQSLKRTIEEDFTRLPGLIAKAMRSRPDDMVASVQVDAKLPEQPELIPAEKKEPKQLSLF
jgi:DNA polymerase